MSDVAERPLTVDHDLGALAQIPAGEGRTFRVGDVLIAVFRTHAGDVFATQAQCPHRGGPLADGLIGGAAVVCPLHDRAFDLRTGSQQGGDLCLATYPARIDGAGHVVIAARR